MKNLRAAVLALCAISCAQQPKQPAGSARFSVDAVTSGVSITSVTVEVQPANVSASLAFDAASGTFTGTLNVAAGAQTFTVRAYAGTTLVGTGTATATVVAGQTVNVAITVLDESGPPPTPPNKPYITSLVVPATVDAGAQATFTAAAVDPQGDTLAYEWSQSCVTGVGTFGTPAAASTTWTAPGSETTCQVTVKATSPSSLLDTKTATVVVGAATSGNVGVTVDYVPQPVIDRVWLQTAAAPVQQVCSIGRSDASATCPDTLPPASTWTVAFTFQGGDGQAASATLTDDCGGSAVQDPQTATSTAASAAFRWTAPDNTGVCILSAKVTSGGLTDTFPVEVVLAGTAAPPPPPTATPTWTRVLTTDGANAPKAIWGSGPNDVWAVGGRTIRHWDGSSWSSVETTIGTRIPSLLGVWGSGPSDVWAVGSAATPWDPFNPSSTDTSGAILHWDGTAWSTSWTGGNYAFYEVFGTGPSDVWAVSQMNSLLHWDGAAWSMQPMDTNNPYSYGLAQGSWKSAADDVWVVGSYGVIEHWNGSAWSSFDVGGPITGWNGVWGSGADDVWAAGNRSDNGYGMIAHWDGTAWSSAQVGQDPFYSVWGSGPNDVWAFGLGLTSVHWNGSAWSTVPIDPNILEIWSAWGSSLNDVWAVGWDPTVRTQNGVILRYH